MNRYKTYCYVHKFTLINICLAPDCCSKQGEYGRLYSIYPTEDFCEKKIKTLICNSAFVSPCQTLLPVLNAMKRAYLPALFRSIVSCYRIIRDKKGICQKKFFKCSMLSLIMLSRIMYRATLLVFSICIILQFISK